MKVTLVSKTEAVPELQKKGIKSLGDLICYSARVSNPANQFSTENDKLIGYLIRNQHWSPFEMTSMCVEIQTTRDIGRQILRHRSFSYQEFCVAEGTLITTMTKSGRSKKVPIEKLFERQQSPQYSAMSDWLVRAYDDVTKKLIPVKVKEVFKTGSKECYKLTLHDGKTIECTEEHKFFTRNGFSALKNIKVGDGLAINGTPVYRDRDWLEQAKIRSIENKTGVEGIAEEAGCSYHTIRKWLARHRLQFTKKEVASYTDIWNKGLPKEEQPKFNKPTSKETRLKQSASSRKGQDNNLYINGNYSIDDGLSWRKRISQICKGEHLSLLVSQGFKCVECNSEIDRKNSEVDHKLPVHLFPEKALDITNLRALCKECHSTKTIEEGLRPLETIKWAIVESIEYIGEKETYDIEVDHDCHNYVANGIITHNSQRYAEVSLDFVIREARLQDSKNRQNSIWTHDDSLKAEWAQQQLKVVEASSKAYQWALEKNIAKEQARVVLPEGMTKTTMYMNGTIRSWIHFVGLRSGNGTQKEHQEIAIECGYILEREGIKV